MLPVGGGEFRQDKARLRQQFRRRMLAVVTGVCGEVGDPEIGAEVDDLLARGNQRPGVRGRGAVRQREKEQGDVARGEGRGIGVDKAQAAIDPAQRRNHLRQRLARMLARRDRTQRDLGVVEEELDERFAGITGRTDDTDFHGKVFRRGRKTSASRTGSACGRPADRPFCVPFRADRA